MANPLSLHLVLEIYGSFRINYNSSTPFNKTYTNCFGSDTYEDDASCFGTEKQINGVLSHIIL